MRLLTAFFLTACFASSAQAEYRVYRLKITNTAKDKSREVLSNLLPREYAHYHPLAMYETIEIVDHWMCWKRSDGFAPYCTRPFDSAMKDLKTPSPAPTLSP